MTRAYDRKHFGGKKLMKNSPALLRLFQAVSTLLSDEDIKN
jgi:hypothetical protein